MYAQVIRNSGIRPDTEQPEVNARYTADIRPEPANLLEPEPEPTAVELQADEIARDRADRHGERYTDEELDRQYLRDEGRKAVPGDEVWHDIYRRGPAGEYLERLEIDRVYTKQQDGSWDWRRGWHKQHASIGPVAFVEFFGRDRQPEWPARETVEPIAEARRLKRVTLDRLASNWAAESAAADARAAA